jgi:hypothetical protein
VGPTVTPCGHTFCHFCILEWTADKRNCPICRKSIADAGGLQKHVQMDNFVGKMYAFLSGPALSARDALIRDRAQEARSASARREATATSSSSYAAIAREARLRYVRVGITSERPRFMDVDDNGGTTPRISPVEAYSPPSSWRSTSTLLLQQHSPAAAPAPPASSLPAPLATPTSTCTSAVDTSSSPLSSLWDDSPPPRYLQARRRVGSFQQDSNGNNNNNSVASVARTRTGRLHRLHRYGGGSHERTCDSAGNGGTTTTASGADRPRCSSSRAPELIQSVPAMTAASSESERDRGDRAVGEGAINDNVGLLSPAERDEGQNNNNNSRSEEVRDLIKW